MRNILIITAALVLAGCEVTTEPTPEGSNKLVLANAEVPSPSPSPSPTPVIHAPRSLFSTWAGAKISNGYTYTVNLGVLVDEDPSHGIRVTQGVVWFVYDNFPATNRCAARVNIEGTQDNGYFEVTEINSGSQLINSVYCNGLGGRWDYVATVDGYRLQRSTWIFDWK